MKRDKNTQNRNTLPQGSKISHPNGAESSGESEAVKEYRKACAAYRDELVKCQHDQIDQFDKAVMTLSAGALGVSFAFIKDIVKPENMVSTGYLLGAWVFWGASILSVVFSFYFSHLAKGKAIKQLDEKKIHLEQLGGVHETVTARLTLFAGVSFFIGLVLMVLFVQKNLHDAKSGTFHNYPKFFSQISE